MIIENIIGKKPLVDYPWKTEVDRLLNWLSDKDSHVKAFCFDLVMSLAYVDATSGLEKHIEQCDHIDDDYNTHLGFINLCSPCYIYGKKWSYQKAIKPQSGALGKLSSEVILRFIEALSPQLLEVLVIGGTAQADAILKHKNGLSIFAEVKSAPLITYPFLFKVPEGCLQGDHEKIIITSSQLKNCDSAIFLHGQGPVKLGKVGDKLWPFKPLVDFLINEKNYSIIIKSMTDWLSARDAYAERNRDETMFYLTNASGMPPRVARERDDWPSKESISDSKTSAGMDRTDDIKKGIYQTLKISSLSKENYNVRTAIVSNLPAYRHGLEYVDPFIDMLWGVDSDIQKVNGIDVVFLSDLRRVFDYIITIEQPMLRDIKI